MKMQSSTPPPSAVPESVRPAPTLDWTRAAEGVQLAGFAVFLLLNTTGVLPWSFWLDALALWPVLLMSAGLRIAFEKSRTPWVVLGGPLLVLSSLAWVATHDRANVPVGPWVRETRPLPEGAARVQLKAHLAATELQVTADDLDATLLTEAKTAGAPANARLDSRREQDRAVLELKGGWNRRIALPPWRRQSWDLRLPAKLPVRLDLDGAGARIRADLSRGRVEGGRLEGVFLGLDLRLPATKEPVSLRIAGVFNAVQVTVPEGTPVRVHGTGFPFNAVDRGVPGKEGVAGYDVRLEGIFTAISVDNRPAGTAPEAERPKPEAEPPGAS